MACKHHLWAAHTVKRHRAWHASIAFGKHMVERHRAWHAIIALRPHTQSKDVGRGITSPPLDSTHGRTTSGVTCNHPIGQHTIEQCRAWHDITALGQHTRSDYFRHRMTSPPLYSTHHRTTSGVACHHRLWTPHTVKQRRVWHSIITFGQHTRSNYVRRGMPSSPLGSTKR